MSKASGIITLTTDFGREGPFVGVMKGVILSRLPDARIIDLTHEIQAHWPAEAGFWLARSWRYFPLGSVHIAVVDPGVGTDRDIVVAQSGGHIFIAPDNGLLQPVLEGQNPIIHRLSAPWRESQDWPTISATFHGRDIIAPLAAAIAGKQIQPAEVGPPMDRLAPCELETPRLDANGLSGTVVSIDRFGNLITNIDSGLLREFRAPVADVAGKSLQFFSTYGSRKPGEFMALINSFGVVEISCVEENAAQALGTGRGDKIIVRESAENNQGA